MKNELPAACCNHNCWMINCESNLPGLTLICTVHHLVKVCTSPIHLGSPDCFSWWDGGVWGRVPRLSLAHPVLPVAATHTKESTSATTTHTKESTSTAATGPGGTLWGTTTKVPLHVPLLYLGVCKIASDMFDKLLLPQNVPPTPKLGKGKAKRTKQHVADLPS